MFVMVCVRFLKPKIGTLNHDNRIVLTVGGASRNGTAVTPGMSPIARPVLIHPKAPILGVLINRAKR